MERNVLITGVAGFTGRNLVALLRSLPEKPRIIGIDRREYALASELDAFHTADLNKTGRIAEIVENDPPTHVIHLASALPPASEADMWYSNVGGTLSLIWALKTAGIKGVRLLSIGSAGEYLSSSSGLMREDSPCGGETLNGRTKWAQTTMALNLGKEFNIPIIVARPFNLVGPGLSHSLVAGELSAQFASSEKGEIWVGNTGSERDFVDVRDAVEAYWELVKNGKPGAIYNVCSGIPNSIQDLISILSDLDKGLHDVKIDQSRIRAVDPDRIYGDARKINVEIGWRPRISLRQSLMDMLEEERR